jgi:hypothetical protein
MGVLDQYNPALDHTGEGVAGIDDLRWPSLISIICSEVELSVSGEEGVYYFSPNPAYEIALIAVQEIERPPFPLG